MDERNNEEDAGGGSAGSSSSPIRRYLQRRPAQIINLPPMEDEDGSESSESEASIDDAAPLPSTENQRQSVSVKQALGGLFSPMSSIGSTSADSGLFVVKKYSQGKTFRQRLSYLVFKHTKTSLFFRYVILLLTSIMVLLYFAEAIFIDVVIHNHTTDALVLPCFNLTGNLTNPSIVELILVPKPLQIWALQTFFAILCLLGGVFAIYVRQEIHGSLFKHFHRNFDFHVFLVIILGILFALTVFFPPCLHLLFIPSFLYCWPARHILLRIITQYSQASFFRHSQSLRNTVISLATFMICFFISCVCVIHHFERLGRQIDIFDSFWFTVVTFSTVGYGDVYPGHWTGKLFMMIFIISALVYLPSKLEKLWTSFRLHRKHYRQYQQRGSGKHIILITVALKPLILRDFINEIYADPKQLDTHSVLLIEQEPNDAVKQLLTHPIWSQRITVLLGSGLRMADLARARARSADACFIHTAKYSGSTEDADRHTILCAWTLKSYAPKCKQYIHIIRPENKVHLHIADEIICERELTNSLLAMNVLCPGISTVASLLMHTFPYEGRGYNHPDYQLYEKCSPCEIYTIKLDQSRYFHHFAGKNFLFSSVIAYRKFHVVLLGVRPADGDHMMMNPGIHYIMKPDDTCYYIAETKEEYSNFQVIKPTSIQEGLWNASATLGLLSMYVVGIDPEKFVTPSEDEESDEQKNVIIKRMMSIKSERRVSLESLNNNQSPRRRSLADSPPPLVPLIEEEPSEVDDIGSLDAQITAEVTNWHEEAQVGVQLFKYHGEHNEKKPVVLLNVVPHKSCGIHTSPVLSDSRRHCYVRPDRESLPTCPLPTEYQEFQPDLDSNPVCPLDPHAPEVVVIDTISDKEDNQLKEKLVHKTKSHSHAAVFNFFHRPSHDNDHHHHHHHHHHHGSGPADLHRRSTSFLRLNLHKADTASIHSGLSSISETSQLSPSHTVDPLVVLELDDISEKEELEDLEEGRPHDLKLPLIDEDPPKLSQSTCEEEDTDKPLPSPGGQFRKDQIPVLPYCGCEPLHCYLQPQRTLSEIQISSSCFCEQIQEQWHEKALLVYAERSTPSLFHCIAPLRARNLPLKALKPIVFILATPPDRNFVSVISEVPMVYFLIGSIKCINDLIRAGIMCADFMVVLSPPEILSAEHESLADAENIAALHQIARLFPHLRFSMDVTFRYNIRFLYTTPYEQWSLQHLRQMARKGDHLTYLFLPQVASGKAFAGSMLDTLLYQSYQKPHIIDVFRQMIGCLDVEGSGFLWSVSITEELLNLSTYVRVFQRLVSTLGYIPIAVYRTSRVTTKFDPKDIKGFDDHEVKNLRVYLQGRLHSLGLSHKVDSLVQPQHQHFVFLNPSPDFILQEEDIIIVVRPPPAKHNGKGFSSPTQDNQPPPATPTTFSRLLGTISSSGLRHHTSIHGSYPSIPTEISQRLRYPSHSGSSPPPPPMSAGRPPTVPLMHRESSRNFFFNSYHRRESTMSLRNTTGPTDTSYYEL